MYHQEIKTYKKLKVEPWYYGSILQRPSYSYSTPILPALHLNDMKGWSNHHIQDKLATFSSICSQPEDLQTSRIGANTYFSSQQRDSFVNDIQGQINQSLVNYQQLQGLISLNYLSCISELTKDLRFPYQILETKVPGQATKDKSNLSALKSPQSKFKNLYGLVTGRVIRSCKEHIKQSQSSLLNEGENNRLNYISKKLKEDNVNDEKFSEYLQQFHKNGDKTTKNRGKYNVFNFLLKDQEFGIILIDLIIEFLNEKNSDFRDYISQGSDHKKYIVQVFKDRNNLLELRKKFESMKSDLIGRWDLHIEQEETIFVKSKNKEN